MIFVFATLYGFGKTFFWPTTLGVVSEQCPKGGALTLNAIAGIGMLAVGILGGPVIGKMAEDAVKVSVISATSEETYGKISKDSTYFLGDYTAVELAKIDDLEGEEKDTVKHSIQVGKQASLATVAIFPVSCSFATWHLFFTSKDAGVINLWSLKRANPEDLKFKRFPPNPIKPTQKYG